MRTSYSLHQTFAESILAQSMRDIAAILSMSMVQNPVIKKCNRGNGTKLTANFRKSLFN